MAINVVAVTGRPGGRRLTMRSSCLARGHDTRDSLCLMMVETAEKLSLWFFCLQARDSLAAGRPDVLPGGPESLDSSAGPQATTPQHWAEPPVRRKESVAHMTFGGLAFVVAVSKGSGNVTLLLQDP